MNSPIQQGLAILVSALLLVSCGDSDPAESKNVSATTMLPASEWPNFGGAPSEQHYSPVDQINTANIDHLSLAWYYDLPSENTLTGPVMADGKVFITTGHSTIRALDAESGKLIWEFDSGTRERSGFILRYGYGGKGLAYWNGKVYLITHDGIVMALDAGTGKQLWQQRTFEPNGSLYADGPPRVFNGKLIIGHAGADTGPNRGYVDCFDAETGKKLWRFYTVPGNPAEGFESEAMAMAAKTWSGEWWRWGGGGTAWNAFSYDPELNYFYIGTGNGFPYNHTMRSEGKGDNLFLASIVAVNADSGEYVWHYQTTPGEQTDYNAVMDMTLATLEIDGQQRKVLMQAPKNGFLYVLDRATGELLSAEKIAKVTWATHINKETGRPVENPGYRYHGKDMFELWPGVTGAHNWTPQSYSPKTGLLYIPVMERASLVGDKGLDLNSAEAMATLGMLSIGNLDVPGARESFLKAWDPVTQTASWVVQTPGDWPGGTLATAGNLVFQGRIDGKFVAYDAADGSELWSYNVGVPVVAPPISYAVNGRQYVSVLTGNGASGGGLFSQGTKNFRTDYRMPRRVLTFALDGKQSLPDNQPPAPRVVPADPEYQANLELEKQGATQYLASVCIICHGTDAISGGTAPDLRYSPIPSNREAFNAIVRDGALVSRGMPRFEELTDQQLESIRQYLRARARQTAENREMTKQDVTGSLF